MCNEKSKQLSNYLKWWVMVVSKWTFEAVKLVNLFLSNKLTATDFVDKYIDLWHDKTIEGKTEIIDAENYIKDDLALAVIFGSCDMHESMNDADVIKGYTDQQLKEQVEFLISAKELNNDILKETFTQRGWVLE